MKCCMQQATTMQKCGSWLNVPGLSLALLMAAGAGSAMADLQDEVQVYDDSINAPGERGLELHVNATPRGRRTGNYSGEVPPSGAIR